MAHWYLPGWCWAEARQEQPGNNDHQLQMAIAGMEGDMGSHISCLSWGNQTGSSKPLILQCWHIQNLP